MRDSEVRVPGPFDHELFRLESELAFSFAFRSADRCADTSGLRCIHVSKPEIGSVNAAGVSIRPVDTGCRLAWGSSRIRADGLRCGGCDDEALHA